MLGAVNPAGRALGLRPSQSHADARAIAPGLLSAPAEPQAAAAALERLALWAERYSPLAAMETTPGFEGLMLDMTGGAHLFGGEAALLEDIVQRLSNAAVPARAAVADTPGAAWALARFGDEPIAPPGGARQALAALPMEALRLEDPAVRLLGRLGLRRIGDLYGLPRAGLARRFSGEAGLQLVRRLDQALGAQTEALQAVRRPPLYRVWRTFLEPLIDVAGVEWVLPDLVGDLSRQLEQGGTGARSVGLVAFRTDGRTTEIEASLSAAARSPAHILRLLKEKGLDRLDLGFGADAVMVCAHRTEALTQRQGDLQSSQLSTDNQALAGLIDRLSARLGEGAVRRPVAVQSHLPERSERWARAGPDTHPAPPMEQDRPRPLMLLDPPERIEAVAELPDSAPARFVWRRMAHRVLRAQGPERLSPEWWRAASDRVPRTRDYYTVEDEAGRRFWLFREGLYDRIEAEPLETRPPSWWLHGVFA